MDSSSNECKICDYMCGTCRDSPVSCLTCSHPSRKLENSCRCQFGEFEDFTTLECRKVKNPVANEVIIDLNKKKCGKNCLECDNINSSCTKCG